MGSQQIIHTLGHGFRVVCKQPIYLLPESCSAQRAIKEVGATYGGERIIHHAIKHISREVRLGVSPYLADDKGLRIDSLYLPSKIPPKR